MLCMAWQLWFLDMTQSCVFEFLLSKIASLVDERTKRKVIWIPWNILRTLSKKSPVTVLM